jgi:hypothetical protein
MGTAVLTADQMESFVHSINPNAPYIAELFLEEGAQENVRGDMAFAQSLKETGYFRYGGVVQPDYNNYSGIGAVDPTAIGKAARFNSPREGVRAQIQHLKAYASKEPLNNEQIDPRFHLVTRGIAPNYEDLNGRWAVPGDGYGESIKSIYETMANFSGAYVTPSVKTTQVTTTPKANRLSSLWEKLRAKRERSFERCRSIRAVRVLGCTPERGYLR